MRRFAVVALVLLCNIAQAERLALPVLVLVHAPQVPQAHRPVLATRHAHVVFYLHALHCALMPAQPPNLLACEQVPDARLRVLLRRCH